MESFKQLIKQFVSRHPARIFQVKKIRVLSILSLGILIGGGLLNSCRTEALRTYGFRLEQKAHSTASNTGTDRPELLRMVSDQEVLTVIGPRESHGVKSGFSDLSDVQWIAPLDPENRLVVVELDQEHRAPLRGERRRWGSLGHESFALIELPADESVHAWLGDHRLYAAELESFEGTWTHEALTDRSPWRLRGLESDFFGSVNEAFLEEKLSDFSGAKNIESSASPQTILERGSESGRQRAREWIKAQFGALGYQITEHRYRGQFSEGVNVIAERVGQNPDKALLLSAHYDSVNNAGADDNGAGVVAMLGIAQGLRASDLDIGLKMVFFDQEEKGLIGSKAYVDSLKRSGQLSQVVGNINFEMLGFDSDGDGAFHVIDCNENTSAKISGEFVAALKAQPDLGLERVKACTNRSDHASFWRYGKPAVVISQNFFGGDGNPCYHQACDKIDRVNFSYMLRLIKLTQDVVLSLTAVQ